MQESSLGVRRIPFFTTCLAMLAVLGQPNAGWQDCAVTTVPTLRTVSQPDGEPIQLHFRGNGFNHWYEDLDGFPVVETPDGFRYARLGAERELEATEGAVGSCDPASLGIVRRVAPAPSSQPAHGMRRTLPSAAPQGTASMVTGTIQNLVLLLRFSNHGPDGQDRTLPSVANVTTIMNAVGGDPTLAPTGSVRDYYLEASYGALTIDSTVVGWLDLPESEVYYANGFYGLTSLTWDLITAGLEAADPLVDFADFDDDGDGFIDMITVIHSGYGAEWGGSDVYGTDYADRMWSHKWTIPTWSSDEGVQVADYNISPGLWALSGSNPGRIGVVCHELGHFLGLPDLYDTDGSSNGAGNWCLMASGSWGFDGSQQYPSHLSAWCKTKLGWASSELLLPGTHSALQVETNPTVYRIDSGYPPGEYLLIENRQPLGFDAEIPQGGLAIWHIDEGKGTFSMNDANQDEGYPAQAGWPGNDNHYRVALLQADGDFALELSNQGDAGDPYHSGTIALLDWLTTPNTNAYQDGTIGVNQNRILGIGASSASIPFTYANTAAPALAPVSPPNAFVGMPYSAPILASGGSSPLTWSEYLPEPSYTLTDLGPQPFVTGGSSLGFNADEGTVTVGLPFAFPYYETSYSSVQLTSNGCLDLARLENEFYNTTSFLRSLPRIAPLWDDLTTDAAPGQDVYVSASASSVRYRWEAEPSGSGLPANFAVTLYQNGRIRFDYGSGNTGLSPTVGISRGQGGELEVAGTHAGQSELTDASSLEFTLAGSQLPPGLFLSSSGILSGTATTLGLFEFHVRVTDSAHRYDQKPTRILVRKKPGFPGTGPALYPAPFSIRWP